MIGISYNKNAVRIVAPRMNVYLGSVYLGAQASLPALFSPATIFS